MIRPGQSEQDFVMVAAERKVAVGRVPPEKVLESKQGGGRGVVNPSYPFLFFILSKLLTKS
jgi:hypothetical protein